jgi:predicted dinucleotide-binding enzyme
LNIGILGTGRVANTLAGGLVEAGHSVTLGSRRPEANRDLSFPVAGQEEAVESTELAINATPGSASVEVVEAIGPDAFAGNIFVSGDDSEARATVSGLLEDLGWTTEAILDLGGVESARGPEHYFLLFAALWQPIGSSPGEHAGCRRAFAGSGLCPLAAPRSARQGHGDGQGGGETRSG